VQPIQNARDSTPRPLFNRSVRRVGLTDEISLAKQGRAVQNIYTLKNKKTERLWFRKKY